METKKSKKADLEWKKPVFFQLGVFVALGLILTAFELTGTQEGKNMNFNLTGTDIDVDVVIPVIDPEIPKPKPAPPSNTVLKVIEDINKVKSVVEIDATYNESSKTEVYKPVESTPEPEIKDEPFIFVEQDPQFPGGNEALRQFLNENVMYPRIAREVGIEGTVIVEFVVERDGSITNIRVERGKAQSLDQEAVRVIKAMPKWIPGKQGGKGVRVKLKMPIKFQLQ